MIFTQSSDGPPPVDGEARFFEEEGLMGQVATLVGPVAQGMGFRLVRVKLFGTTVQIMAERRDGSFSIADCEALSRALSPVLDVEDPIPFRYRLEVSSPGIDRPLVRALDFAKWIGHEVKGELRVPVSGRRRFRGELKRVDAEGFAVEMEEEFFFPFSTVLEAHLVLTDRLIAAARQGGEGEAHSMADGALWTGEETGDIEMEEEDGKDG